MGTDKDMVSVQSLVAWRLSLSGLVLVMIFLIVMYLVPGVVASLALALYTTMLIGILKVQTQIRTMTKSGMLKCGLETTPLWTAIPVLHFGIRMKVKNQSLSAVYAKMRMAMSGAIT